MTLESHPLPDGQVFMASDRMILADSFESIAAAGFVFGKEGHKLAIHLTFEGRLNNGNGARGDVTVALSPADTLALVDQLIDTLDLIRAGDIR